MLHVSNRRAAGVLAALLVALGLAAAVPSRATEDFTLSRVAGDTRYETAAAAALDAFGTGADAAVLARGDAFPDALAGSYLTGVLGAPVLLTASNELPDATADALDALGVSTVYLLGGTGAISEAVATDAAGDGDEPRTVERVAGSNRYATAAEIATRQGAAGIGEIDGARTALLVSGVVFADALAAGPIAHAHQLPVLLTPPGSLAPEAASAIDELGIEHLVVVGGTAAVSDAVVDAAEAAGAASSERVAGTNRFATAVAVADFALDTFEDTDDSTVDLATGEKFADALAAGPASGEANRPLLLTASASLSSEAATWLADNAGTLQSGRVFGGTSAVSDAVLTAAEAAASGASATGGEGQLTFANPGANTYRYVVDGAKVSTTVTYENTDTFTVDGNAATVGGFETQVTPGDRINFVPASGTTAARHELTNVAASSITEGTIGNVDIENQQLDIVNEVNGDAIRSNVSYADVLYEIGGAPSTESAFEADVNEGDELEITGTASQTTFELTNVDVVGSANSIVVGNPLVRTIDLKIGALGDDPATDDDDTYQANGDPTADDEFKVEGASSDYAGFSDALTQGDAVTYRRVGGIETFELINRSPSVIKGQAVDDLEPAAEPPVPIPGTEGGGGTFTIVTADGPVEVTYVAGGTYVVDGRVANRAEFEAAYSAGDLVSFRAADQPSGTTQRVELTNRVLQGPIDPESITTEDSVSDPTSDAVANSYGVLGQDGETILRQVEYAAENASSNTYFVNGAAVTLERFEQELNAVKAGTRSGTAQVQTTGTGDAAVTQHRLATTGTPVTTSSTTSTTSGGGLLV